MKPRWSAAELRALRKLYPRAPWDQILRALPRRERTTIWEKAHTIGVRRVEVRVEHHDRAEVFPRRVTLDSCVVWALARYGR